MKKKILIPALALVSALCFSACSGWEFEIKHPDEEQRGVMSENSELEQSGEENKKQELTKSEKEVPASGGMISEKMYSQIFEKRDASYEEFLSDAAEISFKIPESFLCTATFLDETVLSFEIYREPAQDKERPDFYIWLYKDGGTTYDDAMNVYSVLPGINESTYFEVSGENFERGNYIRMDYPTKGYEDDPGAVPSYARYYQLQFEGFVAEVHAYIRLGEEQANDENVCEEFINSITVSGIDSGEIQSCEAAEAAAFAETDEAKEYAEYLAYYLSHRDFSKTAGSFTSDILWIYLDLGGNYPENMEFLSDFGSSVTEGNAEFFAVPKADADRFMLKYFGTAEYAEPNENYDPETETLSFPLPRDGFGWDIDSLEVSGLENNRVTYECVSHYCIYDEGIPGPFFKSFITFDVMEDEGGKFLRLVSCKALPESYKTPEEALGEASALPEVTVTFNGKAEFEDFSFSMLKSSTMYDWTWERGWVQKGNIIYDEDGNEYIIFAGKLEVLDESEPFSETDKLFPEAEITRELSFNGFHCQLYVTKEPIEGLDLSKTTYNYCILSGGSLYRIELHPTMGRGGFDVQVDPFEKCLETIEFK